MPQTTSEMDRYRYLYIASTLLLLIGAATGIAQSLAMDIVYLVGALGYGLYYVLVPTDGLELRMRRLVRMNVFAALLFILSAVARLGVLDAYGSQLWVVCLLLGLIFMVYASVIPMLGKDRTNEDKN